MSTLAISVSGLCILKLAAVVHMYSVLLKQLLVDCSTFSSVKWLTLPAGKRYQHTVRTVIAVHAARLKLEWRVQRAWYLRFIPSLVVNVRRLDIQLIWEHIGVARKDPGSGISSVVGAKQLLLTMALNMILWLVELDVVYVDCVVSFPVDPLRASVHAMQVKQGSSVPRSTLKPTAPMETNNETSSTATGTCETPQHPETNAQVWRTLVTDAFHGLALRVALTHLRVNKAQPSEVLTPSIQVVCDKTAVYLTSNGCRGSSAASHTPHHQASQHGYVHRDPPTCFRAPVALRTPSRCVYVEYGWHLSLHYDLRFRTGHSPFRSLRLHHADVMLHPSAETHGSSYGLVVNVSLVELASILWYYGTWCRLKKMIHTVDTASCDITQESLEHKQDASFFFKVQVQHVLVLLNDQACPFKCIADMTKVIVVYDRHNNQNWNVVLFSHATTLFEEDENTRQGAAWWRRVLTSAPLMDQCRAVYPRVQGLVEHAAPLGVLDKWRVSVSVASDVARGVGTAHVPSRHIFVTFHDGVVLYRARGVVLWTQVLMYLLSVLRRAQTLHEERPMAPPTTRCMMRDCVRCHEALGSFTCHTGLRSCSCDTCSGANVEDMELNDASKECYPTFPVLPFSLKRALKLVHWISQFPRDALKDCTQLTHVTFRRLCVVLLPWEGRLRAGPGGLRGGKGVIALHLDKLSFLSSPLTPMPYMLVKRFQIVEASSVRSLAHERLPHFCVSWLDSVGAYDHDQDTLCDGVHLRADCRYVSLFLKNVLCTDGSESKRSVLCLSLHNLDVWDHARVVDVFWTLLHVILGDIVAFCTCTALTKMYAYPKNSAYSTDVAVTIRKTTIYASKCTTVHCTSMMIYYDGDFKVICTTIEGLVVRVAHCTMEPSWVAITSLRVWVGDHLASSDALVDHLKYLVDVSCALKKDHFVSTHYVKICCRGFQATLLSCHSLSVVKRELFTHFLTVLLKSITSPPPRDPHPFSCGTPTAQHGSCPPKEARRPTFTTLHMYDATLSFFNATTSGTVSKRNACSPLRRTPFHSTTALRSSDEVKACDARGAVRTTGCTLGTEDQETQPSQRILSPRHRTWTHTNWNPRYEARVWGRLGAPVLVLTLESGFYVMQNHVRTGEHTKVDASPECLDMETDYHMKRLVCHGMIFSVLKSSHACVPRITTCCLRVAFPSVSVLWNKVVSQRSPSSVALQCLVVEQSHLLHVQITGPLISVVTYVSNEVLRRMKRWATVESAPGHPTEPHTHQNAVGLAHCKEKVFVTLSNVVVSWRMPLQPFGYCDTRNPLQFTETLLSGVIPSCRFHALHDNGLHIRVRRRITLELGDGVFVYLPTEENQSVVAPQYCLFNACFLACNVSCAITYDERHVSHMTWTVDSTLRGPSLTSPCLGHCRREKEGGPPNTPQHSTRVYFKRYLDLLDAWCPHDANKTPQTFVVPQRECTLYPCLLNLHASTVFLLYQYALACAPHDPIWTTTRQSTVETNRPWCQGKSSETDTHFHVSFTLSHVTCRLGILRFNAQSVMCDHHSCIPGSSSFSFSSKDSFGRQRFDHKRTQCTFQYCALALEYGRELRNFNRFASGVMYSHVLSLFPAVAPNKIVPLVALQSLQLSIQNKTHFTLCVGKCQLALNVLTVSLLLAHIHRWKILVTDVKRYRYGSCSTTVEPNARRVASSDGASVRGAPRSASSDASSDAAHDEPATGVKGSTHILSRMFHLFPTLNITLRCEDFQANIHHVDLPDVRILDETTARAVLCEDYVDAPELRNTYHALDGHRSWGYFASDALPDVESTESSYSSFYASSCKSSNTSESSDTPRRSVTRRTPSRESQGALSIMQSLNENGFNTLRTIKFYDRVASMQYIHKQDVCLEETRFSILDTLDLAVETPFYRRAHGLVRVVAFSDDTFLEQRGAWPPCSSSLVDCVPLNSFHRVRDPLLIAPQYVYLLFQNTVSWMLASELKTTQQMYQDQLLTRLQNTLLCDKTARYITSDARIFACLGSYLETDVWTKCVQQKSWRMLLRRIDAYQWVMSTTHLDVNVQVSLVSKNRRYDVLPYYTTITAQPFFGYVGHLAMTGLVWKANDSQSHEGYSPCQAHCATRLLSEILRTKGVTFTSSGQVCFSHFNCPPSMFINAISCPVLILACTSELVQQLLLLMRMVLFNSDLLWQMTRSQPKNKMRTPKKELSYHPTDLCSVKHQDRRNFSFCFHRYPSVLTNRRLTRKIQAHLAQRTEGSLDSTLRSTVSCSPDGHVVTAALRELESHEIDHQVDHDMDYDMNHDMDHDMDHEMDYDMDHQPPENSATCISFSFSIDQISFSFLEEQKVFCRCSVTTFTAKVSQRLCADHLTCFSMDVKDILVKYADEPPNPHTFHSSQFNAILAPLLNDCTTTIITLRGRFRTLRVAERGIPFFVRIYDEFIFTVHPLQVNLRPTIIEQLYMFVFPPPRSTRETIDIVNPRFPLPCPEPPRVTKASKRKVVKNTTTRFMPTYQRCFLISPLTAVVTFHGGHVNLQNVQLRFKPFVCKHRLGSIRKMFERYCWSLGRQTTRSLISQKVKSWIGRCQRKPQRVPSQPTRSRQRSSHGPPLGWLH